MVWDGTDSPYDVLTLYRGIQARLDGARLDATVLVSESSSHPGRKFYIDIMPPNGGKYGALIFLTKSLGVTADHVFYAGDSGNDRSVLNRSNAGCRVFVGKRDSVWASFFETVYISQEQEARGVIEGMRYCNFMESTGAQSTR